MLATYIVTWLNAVSVFNSVLHEAMLISFKLLQVRRTAVHWRWPSAARRLKSAKPGYVALFPGLT